MVQVHTINEVHDSGRNQIFAHIKMNSSLRDCNIKNTSKIEQHCGIVANSKCQIIHIINVSWLAK